MGDPNDKHIGGRGDEGGSVSNSLMEESQKFPSGNDNSNQRELSSSVTTNVVTDNVGHLLIAFGEIFGNELVSNQQRVNRNTETLNMKGECKLQTTECKNKNENGNSGSHKCEVCKEFFMKKTDLKQHMFLHNGHFKFKCDFKDCGWSFKSKYKLERHQTKHGAKNKFICPMENCGQSFNESYKLKSHIQSHWKIIKCQENGCNLIFTSKKELESHLKKVHSPKQFKCRIDNCNSIFDSKAQRDVHVRVHGRFACSFIGCGQLFSRKSYLDVHTRSHTNERPFKCNHKGCFATFTSSSKLNRHRNTHDVSRPFLCTYDGCDASFKRKDNLNQHIRMHHLGDSKFKCPFEGCNSTFIAQSSLKEHICVHTKEHSYVCPLEGCTKIYYSKSLLRTHVRRHQSKIAREEKYQQDCNNLVGESQRLSEMAMKANDASQQIDISVNEVLIPAKSDAVGLINNNGDVAGLNSENTVIALGEAVCFQYMNAADQLPTSKDGLSREQIETVSSQKITNLLEANSASDSNAAKSKTCESKNSSEKRNSTTACQDGKHQRSKNILPDFTCSLHNVSNPISLETSSPDTTDDSRTENPENSLPIFSSGSITVPLSMTRFLPREIQINELFQTEYPADHAYNRSLLPVDSRTVTTSESRSIDNAIENALTSSEFGGFLAVSNVTDSMVEMRSFLVENGMASFLANDDIGRMETCTSQDDLGISRKFDRSHGINSPLMLEDCIMDQQSSSLNTSFNHYSTNDSYVVSLMGSSQMVNEHLLNISHNPTMVDHMYSQHSPEGDDLQIVSEDQVYEESTVNIQDIR